MTKLTETIKWAAALDARQANAIERLAAQTHSIRAEVNRSLEANQAYLDAVGTDGARQMLLNVAAVTCLNLLRYVSELEPEEALRVLGGAPADAKELVAAQAVGALTETVKLPQGKDYASPYKLTPQADGSVVSEN